MTVLEDNIFVASQPGSLVEAASLGHVVLDRISSWPANDVFLIDHESGRSWTYSQAHDKILDLAAGLIAHYGLKQGDVVCVSFPHCDLTLLLGLAVVCAGGTLACNYHKDPYAELLYQAKKVEPRLLFCARKYLHWAEQLTRDTGAQVRGVSLDNESAADQSDLSFLMGYRRESCAGAPQVPVACRDVAKDIAFVVMSSGTTGRPKAVAYLHSNCLAEMSTTRPGQGRGNVTSVASFDYISGRLTILMAISTGQKLIVMNGFEVESYVRVLERYRISGLALGVASFHSFIAHDRLGEYDLSSLLYAFFGGARITYASELKNFINSYPQIRLWFTAYGTSETSGVSIKMSTSAEFVGQCNNSGPVSALVRVRIVDPESGKSLGKNQTGSVRVSGPKVFPGYIDKERAKLTGDLFVRDASVFDELGYYITGDLAYFDDNEELHVVGREKELMSCRGAKKVVPQELEHLLCQHPAVAEACVLGLPNKREPGLHCPRAFVLVKPHYYAVAGNGCSATPKLVLSERVDSNELSGYEHGQVQLTRAGQHKLCSLARNLRHSIEEDVMRFVHERISLEKQLTGGLVVLDSFETLRTTGKVDKGHLRALTLQQVEVYGDISDQ